MLASKRLRHDVARPSAPLAVRDRLFKAVAHVRIGSQRRSQRLRGLIAALAALTVAVAGTWWVIRPRGEPQRIAELLVSDHQRTVGADGLPSADPVVTTRWLEQQLDFAVQVPTFPNAELLGARVVVLDGRRAVVMQYRIDGRLVSYYVSPISEAPGSAGGLRPPSPARWAGYQVVSWQEPGLLHALVGNLPDARLEELARICIEQMGMTLSVRIALIPHSPTGLKVTPMKFAPYPFHFQGDLMHPKRFTAALGAGPDFQFLTIEDADVADARLFINDLGFTFPVLVARER